MERAVLAHNLTQLSMPFFIFIIVSTRFPSVDPVMILIFSVIGGYVPDFDHFNMWRKVKHGGFWNFVKICITADRHRKAFLPLHNYLSMLIVGVTAVVTAFINFFISVFFISFLIHLILDYIADISIIRRHLHWKFRKWSDENNSRLPDTQQVQQGNK